MREFIISTVVTAVAAVGVAVVCLVCTECIIKLCDETRKDTQLCFADAVNAQKEN